MKILHFTTSLTTGGAEQVLYTLLSSPLARPEEHIVVYLNPGPFVERIQALGIQTIHIPAFRYDRYDLLVAWRLARLIRQHQPTALHTLMTRATCVGRIIGKLCGLPVICDFHGAIEHYTQGRFHRLMHRYTGAFATQYITVNRTLKTLLTDTIRSLPARNVSVIYSGIDTKRIAAGLAHPEQPAPPRGRFVIGALGRLAPVKNYDTLIRVIDRFRRTCSHDRQPFLYLIGDGSERPHLEKLITELGLEEHVFLAGNKIDPYPLFGHFDCFVHTCTSGAISLSVMEAFAAKLPVISTHFEPTHELFECGKNFQIIAVNDADALLKKLQDLYEHTDEYKKASEVNYTLAEKHFGLEQMITKYFEVFSHAHEQQKR